jgi:rhodanese-related sulfurtransferase
MKIFSVLLLSLAFGAMGCSQPVLKKIDVKEAQSLLASNKDHALQVIDLRTPGEIASTGSLPGAEFIDFTANSFEAKLKQLDKTRPVLLYCASGGRSGQTAEMLHKQKFRLVYEMSPGMNGWLAAGYPTSK